MEKWFVYAKKADFKAWGESLGVDPLIARLLRNRDLTEEAEARRFLYGTLKDCHSPWLLRDMDKAVEGILSAVSAGKKVRVIGDYDVDGICASYILTRGIACLGATVDTAIPHRIHDGYGLNEHLIREAAQDGVGLIVTCDNGIAASQQVCLAKELGMEVIITDHHEVPFVQEGEDRREVLPEALAVVDPKRKEDSYPFSGICGAAVAYKVMQALAERLGGEGKAQERDAATRENGPDCQRAVKNLRDSMEEFLEFASFATVCDIMELKDENRILVREGLKRLRNSGNLGLRALMQVCSIDPKTLSAYHLGFVLGPCMNATGRLDTATRALELLSSKDLVEAVTIARDLKELNDSRKNLTLQGIELAGKVIEEQGLLKDKVLVVFLPEVHESLAGIIAGRLREQYGHPAILLTRGEEGVKGSGRSVEGYHMYEALTEVGELLTKFGGHKMAAGLSLPEENIAEFRRRLN
ncbi:MAG: single-stranded-DNA-specific exonuclease RecJ, partial [Lachnospiraceae bacterium]|nr:single-stranded-DNA-specific exonuclease RecJ [Lachnospiraceae bacterium]